LYEATKKEVTYKVLKVNGSDLCDVLLGRGGGLTVILIFRKISSNVSFNNFVQENNGRS
jgi:hypothetical protein